MQIITYVTENAESLVTAALAIVGAASAVCALFGKQNNKYLEMARSLLNKVALNVGKAKNKE